MTTLDIDFVARCMEEADAVGAQAKCTCKHGVATHDASVFWLQFWRCKLCMGLVARARLEEGTATLLHGTIH